jgi:hypothetical protein
MSENIHQAGDPIKVGLPWFRFYTAAIDDPKVQRLSPHLFKTWVNLLCLAGQGGGILPSIDDIAFRLRLSAQDAECHVSDLVLAGLIDITASKALTPHNWTTRQRHADVSTSRVRKFRARNGVKHDETVSETVQIRSDQNRSEQIRSESDQIDPENFVCDEVQSVAPAHVPRYVSEVALDKVRDIAPGWDRQWLLAKFQDWPASRSARHPDKAFLGWVKKFVASQEVST